MKDGAEYFFVFYVNYGHKLLTLSTSSSF